MEFACNISCTLVSVLGEAGEIARALAVGRVAGNIRSPRGAHRRPAYALYAPQPLHVSRAPSPTDTNTLSQHDRGVWDLTALSKSDIIFQRFPLAADTCAPYDRLYLFVWV